jgi:hypothetical protein
LEVQEKNVKVDFEQYFNEWFMNPTNIFKKKDILDIGKEYLLEKGLLMSKDFEGIQTMNWKARKCFLRHDVRESKNNVSSHNIRHSFVTYKEALKRITGTNRECCKNRITSKIYGIKGN